MNPSMNPRAKESMLEIEKLAHKCGYSKDKDVTAFYAFMTGGLETKLDYALERIEFLEEKVNKLLEEKYSK